MKKTTALIVTFVALSFFAALSARADLIWQELFNYPDGQIITNAGSPWIRHSGTGNDAFVKGHRLENQQSSRADDIHRNFPGPYTNNTIPVYASFVLNCTNLPNAAGTYFAHFYTNSSNFHGRLFALVGTNLCLPKTFRLGVSGVASSVNQIFPIDLALNQDYQVVLGWDPQNTYSATLWVDPLSSADTSVQSSDIVSPAPAPALAFAFRQASSSGNCFLTISNLVVATTFDEASTNVWPSNSVPPSIVYQPQPQTNFVTSPVSISMVAAGQGLSSSSFVYQWQKDGVNIDNPSGNANVFTIASAAISDTGNYSVVVSNMSTGTFATSSSALLWITNGLTIGIQPTNQSAYPHQTVTMYVGAYGNPTLNYSWVLSGGGPITSADVDASTTNTASLVITNMQAGDAVGYKCIVSNDYGTNTSATATLTLLTPQTVNIDTLRGMVDPTFFLPTNTAIYYTVTNAVVYTHEATNADGSVNGGMLTAAPNGEFFMQDSSGGIAVYMAGGASRQPRFGDIVNVTGPLGNFNSLLQFNLSAADPSHIVTVVGHTNTLPAPTVLPFSFTNGSGGFISVSNVIRKYEGRLVTLTNAYFAASGNFASGTYIMTNLNGDAFKLFLNAANTNIIGQPIPAFAWTVTGPMGYFLGTTATNRSTGFEIDPTWYPDIVSTPAAPVATLALLGGGKPAISWVAQPYVGYSILWSTNLNGGSWAAIASGLTFTNTAGTYTDSVYTNLPASFYRIHSP